MVSGANNNTFQDALNRPESHLLFSQTDLLYHVDQAESM